MTTVCTFELSLPGLLQPARLVRHARRARRLRLEVPGLRGREGLARRLERTLVGSGLGVEEARADARSGRLLIRYTDGAALLDELRSRPEFAARPRPRRVRRAGRDAESPPQAPWHALTADEALERLASSRDGIDPEEARRRRSRYGPNAVDDAKPRSRLAVLRSQASFPLMLLLGSSGLSLVVREWLDAGAILSAVGLDAAIGYRIERQNETLLASWRRLEAGEARVLRQGPIQKIPAADLVPGDVFVLRAGDTVPADARVLDAHRLACDEAILTGESVPRTKTAASVPGSALLAERTSMVYAATRAVSGRARLVVTGVGATTEVGRIRQEVEAEKLPETPFERRLDQLGRGLSAAGLLSGAAAGALGLLRGRSLSRAVGNATALAVAAIPEGLPVVSTATLLRSMQRMRERGMVVRRLVSAETLGGVTVVCADKTGTLTRNEMEVATLDLGRGRVEIGSVRVAGEKPLDDPAALVLVACVLNSDVELHGRGDGLSVSGSATEKALVRAAQAAGLDPRALVREWPRLWLRERDQGAHFVLSLHEAPDGARVAFAKGAPEEVMRLCERDLSGPIDGEKRAQIWQRNLAFAAEGLRVLAVAWRRGGEGDGERREDWERGYTLLGLVGLRDPLRPDAAATVAAASRAGIRTIILTGDQPATARAVAGAVGLDGGVLDGVEVSRLLRSDNHEIRDRLRRVAALSRVAAADKAALVRALREAGEVVAMAGDGVNDAPALKAADVGIAIGTRASDVAREAADIVLASEDLGSILNAVGEGRVVQDNLRRAIRYLLATNLSEVVLALGATALGTRDPFNATRLLWLNLISDTVPALALALEPAEGAVLARPPAPPDAPLVAADARRKVLRDGVGMALAGAAGLLVGGPAVCFSALAGAELGYAFPCRAPGSSPGERFVRLIGGTAGLHLAAIALPSVRSVLRLPPVLSPLELLAFGAGFVLPWAASRSANDLVVVRRGHAVEETR